MEFFEIYFALKRSCFKNISPYLERPNGKTEEWLVRAIYDCARSPFKTSMVSDALGDRTKTPTLNAKKKEKEGLDIAVHF